MHRVLWDQCEEWRATFRTHDPEWVRRYVCEEIENRSIGALVKRDDAGRSRLTFLSDKDDTAELILGPDTVRGPQGIWVRGPDGELLNSVPIRFVEVEEEPVAPAARRFRSRNQQGKRTEAGIVAWLREEAAPLGVSAREPDRLLVQRSQIFGEMSKRWNIDRITLWRWCQKFPSYPSWRTGIILIHTAAADRCEELEAALFPPGVKAAHDEYLAATRRDYEFAEQRSRLPFPSSRRAEHVWRDFAKQAFRLGAPPLRVALAYRRAWGDTQAFLRLRDSALADYFENRCAMELTSIGQELAAYPFVIRPPGRVGPRKRLTAG